MAGCTETVKELIRDSRTGEAYWDIKHSSGLKVMVWEMAGYSSCHAMFGTKYGSINTTFKTQKDEDFVTVPEGIAHFLEHKLFENEDCDVFALYAKTGASANAATSFDKTYYLFTSTDKFKESLDILLDFVQKPYFTEETVAKEQGIIGQEIKMYEDMPNWRVFFNLLMGLYHNNPVRIDIAGTVESIAQINAPLLYRCYNTFYNLHNMVLSVAGNVTVDEVLEVCDRLLKPAEDIGLETKTPEEPDTVFEKLVTQHLEVAVPLFQIGFKFQPASGLEALKAATEADIALNLLADESSELYKELYEEGLINSSFSTEIFNGDGFFAAMVGGESKDPELVKTRILEAVTKAQQEGLDKERFLIAKKSGYGDLIRELNNVQAVANLMMNASMEGVSPFDYIRAVANVTYEDVQNRFKSFDVDKVTLSVISRG